MDKKNDIEFDLIELLLYMKKRLWIVILTVVLFAVGGYVASKILMTPSYTATAQLYVVYDVDYGEDNRLNDDYTQQLMAGQLRNDCVELLGNENVTAEVIKNLELNMSAGGLSSRLVIEPIENTRVLSMSLTDTSPEMAATIINEVCRVGKEKIQEIVGEDVVKVVCPAEVPAGPSSPSPKRNATVAAILGLVAAVSIMVIVFLMDDSIRTESDMEHYLGLGTLAEIPVSEELNMAKKAGERRGIQSRFRSFKG